MNTINNKFYVHKDYQLDIDDFENGFELNEDDLEHICRNITTSPQEEYVEIPANTAASLLKQAINDGLITEGEQSWKQ